MTTGQAFVRTNRREGAVRTVEAELHYLGQMAERPVFHAVDMSRTNLKLEPHRVRITDARCLDDPPSLDAEGFALVRHESRVRDFRDRDELEGRYLGEVAELIRAVSGASKVLASPGPVARYADRSDEARSAGTAPAARFVHTDYTDVSAKGYFLPQIMDPAEALRRYRRITVYQTWRALSDPPQDVPLTIADGRSVRLHDMVTADTILGEEYGHDQAFEYSMCRYNPGHRWYYFSNMTPEDVLVFKGYDFDRTRPARLFHTAFDDPSAPPNAPPRASIEARAFAFFED
jgi:hypothetical protein